MCETGIAALTATDPPLAFSLGNAAVTIFRSTSFRIRLVPFPPPPPPSSSQASARPPGGVNNPSSVATAATTTTLPGIPALAPAATAAAAPDLRGGDDDIRTAKGEPKGENEAAMGLRPVSTGQTFSFFFFPGGDDDDGASPPPRRFFVAPLSGEKKAGCVGGLLELLARSSSSSSSSACTTATSGSRGGVVQDVVDFPVGVATRLPRLQGNNVAGVRCEERISPVPSLAGAMTMTMAMAMLSSSVFV